METYPPVRKRAVEIRLRAYEEQHTFGMAHLDPIDMDIGWSWRVSFIQ